MKIVYITSLEGHLVVPFSAVENLRQQQIALSFQAFHEGQFKNQYNLQQLSQAVEVADLVIVRLLGNIAQHMQVMEIVKQCKMLCVYASNEEPAMLTQWTTIATPLAQTIRENIRHGSVAHFEWLLRKLISEFNNELFNEAPPCAPAPFGFYSPNYGAISAEDALATLQPACWKALILFHQSHYLNGNIAYINRLFQEVEAQGGSPIAVYTRGDVNEDGVSHIEAIIESTLINAKLDVVLNVMVAPAMLETANVIATGNRVKTAFEKLNVPIIQGMAAYTSKEQWEQDDCGVSQSDVTYHAVLPEFLGHIVTHPIAFKKAVFHDSESGIQVIQHVVDEERLRKYVALAKNWANLGRLRNEEKKIAIVFHNYPPRNDTIGTAQGLDSPQSVVNMLKAMQQSGYTIPSVPSDGQQLMEQLLKVATNDHRYTSYEALAARACAVVPHQTTKRYFASLAQAAQQKIVAQWGEAPGNLMVSEQGTVIPGFLNGHIFIGIQPTRGFEEDPSAALHSPDLAIPHSYYTYYRWLVEEFQADAVVHVGTHGSLEWLPGKSLGLSSSCFPDLAIQTLPNIYPYVVNNPGEGIQAKRRSYACLIGHLSPVLQQSGLYGELLTLDTLLDEYEENKQFTSVKTAQIKAKIVQLVEQLELNLDLQLEKGQLIQLAQLPFEEAMRKLHSLLSEWKHAQVKNGLHIFGEPPAGEKLIDELVSFTRLKNDDIPSFPDIVSRYGGYCYNDLVNDEQQLLTANMTASMLMDKVQTIVRATFTQWMQYAFHTEYMVEITQYVQQQMSLVCAESGLKMHSHAQLDLSLQQLLAYVANELVPNIQQTTDEMRYFLNALSGQYVPPGPSGAPSRGMASLMPTGRNFYGLDPRAIPAKSAWQVGIQLAEDLLAQHLAQEKGYPESVGIVLWGSPMIRTKGDDIAEVLYLLGVTPVWKEGGQDVERLEVIPLVELGRPRIDVTMRISGFLRDGFPHIVNLLDEAVQLVAFLDESDEENFVAKHVRAEMQQLLVDGLTSEQAKAETAIRIFGCKPGAYGAGVNQVIEGKQWSSREELAQAYENWGSYAYGKQRKGERHQAAYARAFGQIELAVKNMDSNEHDIMGSTDYYAYHGGMIAASEVISGQAPVGVIGDSSNPERVKSRTVVEENRRLFRTRILNPKWIESMKAHGYKGAGDISKTFDRTLGWHAVAQSVDSWMFEQLAETFVLNEEYKQWVEQVNPYALMNMTETLLEAQARNMWQPSEDMLAQLQEIYLSIESDMEELGDETS